MADKIAIVTGASSGIGRATALELVAQGYTVYAAARRTDKIVEAQVVGIEALYLDITSQEAIDKAIDTVMDEAGRIDLLVNNAGYGLMGTIEEVTAEEAQHQFDVNVFGLMNLTKKVLPIMRHQRSGTIINVSSIVGKFGMPTGGWYSASKHALEALSDALRIEMKPFGIRVCIIEPGAIKSEFAEIALEKSEAGNRSETYKQLTAKYKELAESSVKNAPDAYVVAKTISDAAASKNPKARYVVPGQAKMLLAAKGVLGDRLFDWMMTRQLGWR